MKPEKIKRVPTPTMTIKERLLDDIRLIKSTASFLREELINKRVDSVQVYLRVEELFDEIVRVQNRIERDFK
jgi:hypothetical protein